jgi:aerobic carbon-monoxide dehydrogenase large subunit
VSLGKLIEKMPGRVIGSRYRSKSARKNLTGRETFVGDIKIPGTLYCKFLRSTYASATIRRINFDKARAIPGVVAILTHDAISPYVSPLKVAVFPNNPSVKPLFMEFLAYDRVRFAGEPIAAVIAQSDYIAADAIDLIDVEYDLSQSVVTTVDDAMQPGSPLLYEDWGDNVFYKTSFRAGKVEESFQKADKIFKETFRNHRYMPSPIEGRAVVANYNPVMGTYEFWSSTQAVHIEKLLLARALKVPENKIRVVAPSVGGGFGLKLTLFAEEVVVGVATFLTKAPVKWIEDRKEHLISSSHAREISHEISVAVDNAGKILAMKDVAIADLGVGTNYPHGHSLMVSAFSIPNAYKMEGYEFQALGVVTNKCPFGAYRGFGGPEAAFATEVMVDKIARALSMDPIEFRLKNLVNPSDYPYTNVTGTILENGSYQESIQKALDAVGYSVFKRKQDEARKSGRYLGIGVAYNAETTAPNICFSTGIITGHDFVRLSIDRDGKLTVYSGASLIGTGIDTALAQVASDFSGVSVDDIDVVVGDTMSSPYSSGLWGSRGAVVIGGAVASGATILREKILKIAAGLLEARHDDLTIEAGTIFVKGVQEKKLDLKDLAEIAISRIQDLPAGAEPGLDIITHFNPPQYKLDPDAQGLVNVGAATTNTAHSCIVEVDIETGAIKILKYVIVHDAGTVINPAIVEGQVIGGAIQSFGGTTLEELVYDSDGQLLSSTFIDYLLPSATDSPNIELLHCSTPTPLIPGGFKGSGESGTISVPPCITNAVVNALEPFGVEISQTPLSPERIWRLVQKKRRAERKNHIEAS